MDTKITLNSIKRALTRCSEKVTSETFNLDLAAIAHEEKKAEDYYKHYVNLHSEQIGQAGADDVEELENMWEEVEAIYDGVCLSLHRYRESLANQQRNKEAVSAPINEELSTSMQAAASHELKLDPLAIPTFDGQLHNWLAFKDAFETMVDGQNLPESFKLGKLRQAVSEEKVPLV